jgi:hypothetical protein
MVIVPLEAVGALVPPRISSSAAELGWNVMVIETCHHSTSQVTNVCCMGLKKVQALRDVLDVPSSSVRYAKIIRSMSA